MFWSRLSGDAKDNRLRASSPEIIRFFRTERALLARVAFLITGDEAAATQCVVNARDLTLQSGGPFGEWLSEWAKAATISSAILRQADLIRNLEAAYKDVICAHPEHLSSDNEAELNSRILLVLETEPSTVISELDPLCRAVLALRVGIRSSIQDCALRLNVCRAAIVAANCRVMEWLGDLQAKADNKPSSLSGDETNLPSPLGAQGAP